MNKKNVPLLVSLFLGFSCFASPLTPDQALSRFLNDGRQKLAFVDSYTLTKEVGLSNEPALYIFNKDKTPGYIILSADDNVASLIGYSDSSSFSENEMSPDFKWWLDQYAEQIEYIRNNVSGQGLNKYMRWEQEEKSAISPLVTTLWNQDAPYNQLCPERNGQKCVTGCAATAMAQVMNYHKYPEIGEGSISYSAPGFSQDLVMGFGKVPFDWDNMLDVYKRGEYNEDEAYAVAYLMRACGYSIRMQYSPSGSGAYADSIAQALPSFFKYDRSIKYLHRDYIEYDEWFDYIYDNLERGLPVLYGGVSEEGGHEFVCDGYAGEGYFHFNWGWAGLSDGYFLLDALDPTSQGIGGALGSFHFNQDIIINIMPKQDDSLESYSEIYVTGQFNPEIYEENYLCIFNETNTTLGSLEYKGVFFNLGYIIENAENPEELMYATTNYEEIEIGSGYVISFRQAESFEECPLIDLSELDLKENTTYKFTVASLNLYDPEAGWDPVRTVVGNPNYFYITKTDAGEYQVGTVGRGELAVSDIENIEPVYANQTNQIRIVFDNPTDYQMTNRLLLLLLNDKDEICYQSGYFMQTVDPESQVERTVGVYFRKARNVTAPVPGTYYLVVYNNDTRKILDMTPLEIYLTNKPYSSVESLTEGEAEIYKVYNLNGQLILTTEKESEVYDLPKGIYIVNGRKIII